MEPDVSTDRNVIITGAASGIGRAVAAACASRGDAVLLLDIDSDAVQNTASELGAVAALQCDVADAVGTFAAASAANELLGRIDLVVHAAGVVVSGETSLATPLEHQRWVIDVNLMGTIHVLNAFVRILVEQSTTSNIVVTGSENSVGVPHLRAAAYTASKHAVLGYADVLRRELPDHVRLSVLCPGLVATDLWRSSEHRQQMYGGAVPALQGGGAMALGMPPEEVAEAVLRGVDADEFLIMSHDHLGELAKERYDTIVDAIARQVPDQGGRYKLERIVELYRSS
jgi:NAD(P)-dependent dehydrogenase (short-subunit alcohol dehydrogenase family)